MTIILTKAEVSTAVSEYLSDRLTLKLEDDKGKSMKLINVTTSDFEMLVELEVSSK